MSYELIVLTAGWMAASFIGLFFGWRAERQAIKQALATTDQLGDAIRLLASRDYGSFAAAAKVEARHVTTREPTDAELTHAAEQEAFRRGQNDPYGVT